MVFARPGVRRGWSKLLVTSALATAGAWSARFYEAPEQDGCGPTRCSPAVPEPQLSRYQTFPKVLGTGACARVLLGRDLMTGTKVAVKCVRHGISPAGEVAAMRRIAASGGHENVLKLLDVVQEPTQTLIVTELAPGEEMYARLARDGPFSEDQAADLAKALAEGVAFLHDKVGLAHCDLKPENLMVESPVDETNPTDSPDESAARRHASGRSPRRAARLKIVDFGCAHLYLTRSDGSGDQPGDGEAVDFGSERRRLAGTNVYRPPESFGTNLEDLATPLGKEADMFALGCVLFLCLYGAHPFDPFGDLDEAEICGRIKFGHWRFLDERVPNVSPQAKDLVTRLLDVNPRTRATAADVLRHPWVQADVTYSIN